MNDAREGLMKCVRTLYPLALHTKRHSLASMTDAVFGAPCKSDLINEVNAK